MFFSHNRQFFSLFLIVHAEILFFSGLAALNPSDGVGVGVYEDLKWKALLCCDHPSVQTVIGGLSENPPEQQCQLLNATKQQSFGKSLTLSG